MTKRTKVWFMLHLITHANKNEFDEELASMHRLRKEIFVDTLGWRHPNIKVIDDAEYDQFDTPNCHYLVHVNEAGRVDACNRLISTTRPYLLADEYPQLVQDIPIPRQSDIWEVSRFCVSHHCTNKRLMGILAAGMLEFALAFGIKAYVSMSDIRIEVAIGRYGWRPRRVGNTMVTNTETCAGEFFEVSQDTFDTVRRKSRCWDGQVIGNLEGASELVHYAA